LTKFLGKFVFNYTSGVLFLEFTTYFHNYMKVTRRITVLAICSVILGIHYIHSPFILHLATNNNKVISMEGSKIILPKMVKKTKLGVVTTPSVPPVPPVAKNTADTPLQTSSKESLIQEKILSSLTSMQESLSFITSEQARRKRKRISTTPDADDVLSITAPSQVSAISDGF